MLARREIAAALLLGAGGLALSRPLGPVPALGPLLDPARGVWAAARGPAVPGAHDTLALAGLRGPVRVVYDRRHVPHIFAATERDAYQALGYVVARDRLFQLHVQRLAASGRLTELAGPAALPLDRETRGLGLPRAAEAKLAAMSADDRAVLDAYAAGVNAYLGSLGAAELPVEFTLAHARPEPWRPIDAVHVMNRMGYTLASEAREADLTAAAARVGARAAAALVPAREPIVEPIQPNGQGSPRDDFAPLPPPGAPDAAAARVAAAYDAFFPALLTPAATATPVEERPHQASNNWAVAPARSATGHALLAGDPHLELSLPSIWYEAHLVVPGRLDVYGVTIPGIPGIVIGFNRDVAWTFTNTGVDVKDFYAEEVDDPAHPTRYRLDGAWAPLERRVEEYRTGAGALVAADTLLFTHRGPMRRTPGAGGARWVSMRWTVLEPGGELGAFRDAARARSAREFLDAMARGYRAPAQNMLAADRGGTIAIRSTGRYPVRPGNGSGDQVRDGRTRAADWTGDLPVDHYPQAFDPAQGYLASANQQPVDARSAAPNAGDYWAGGYDPWRALRINELLRADARVTVDAMRRYQADPGAARADRVVPYFLHAAQRPAPNGVDPDRLAEAGRLLGQWDRRYPLDNTRAVLFEWAMRELAARTWDELDLSPRPVAGVDPFGKPTTRPDRAFAPSAAVLAELLADSASPWWDERATPARETRDDVLAQALVAALDSCREKYGAPDAGGWTWSRLRHANIRHLGRVPAFGALDLPVPGGPNTLWPSSAEGYYGPSWRMVVELGDSVRAWGIYPGGQSGDPLDPTYRDRILRWGTGLLDALIVPRTAEALAPADRAGALTLVPR